MSKKIFTVLLLAVFVLAQFSMASAAAVADADITLTRDSEFLSAAAAAPWAEATFDWSLGALPAGTTYYVDVYVREDSVAYANANCQNVATVNGGVAASGTFTYAFSTATADTEIYEFVMTVDDAASCADAANVEIEDVVMHSAYVDGLTIEGFGAFPQSDTADVACNTFEMWAVGADNLAPVVGDPYSGFGSWNPRTTGTFAPAPVGPDSSLLSWAFTFPSTASGPWVTSINPEDAAGNMYDPTLAAPYIFYNSTPVASELEDCAEFSDTAGHQYELYIRYLADLGLISGFADGTFGADSTLTRAEAATLIEISNGLADTDPAFGTPPVAGSACDFDDVSATDWFAGWVWEACADGFMNGVGGGLFDPNNLLTRGQIVTILNNVVDGGGATSSYLNNGVLWTAFWDANDPIISAPWSDVSVGAFYAEAVVEAYGYGIADGTSATTFSPDQAVTRGEFAKMLYRSLSWYWGAF
jgi:hypothetical protein